MTLQIGILMALACAFATNLGFLYKYREARDAASVDIRHPLRSAGSLFGVLQPSSPERSTHDTYTLLLKAAIETPTRAARLANAGTLIWNVAKVLRLSRFTTFVKIVVPATLPYMFTGFRLSLGIAWLVIVASEMLTGTPGVGGFRGIGQKLRSAQFA